jgi:hypothetical protein
MSNILQIGYTVEGSTDQRFLSNIIRKAFEFVVLDCNADVEVYEPEHLPKSGESFISQLEKIAIEFSYFHVICIHCDSDSPTMDSVLTNKIIPAIEAVKQLENACTNLVAIVPVQMTESWLMADFELLKSKIGTTKSNSDLGLPIKTDHIEKIGNPKDVIINAIKIAQEETSKRRRKVSISSIYSPISQELSIEALLNLPSFNSFLVNVRNALRMLNYMK